MTPELRREMQQLFRDYYSKRCSRSYYEPSLLVTGRADVIKFERLPKRGELLSYSVDSLGQLNVKPISFGMYKYFRLHELAIEHVLDPFRYMYSLFVLQYAERHCDSYLYLKNMAADAPWRKHVVVQRYYFSPLQGIIHGDMWMQNPESQLSHEVEVPPFYLFCP